MRPPRVDAPLLGARARLTVRLPRLEFFRDLWKRTSWPQRCQKRYPPTADNIGEITKAPSPIGAGRICHLDGRYCQAAISVDWALRTLQGLREAKTQLFSMVPPELVICVAEVGLLSCIKRQKTMHQTHSIVDRFISAIENTSITAGAHSGRSARRRPGHVAPAATAVGGDVFGVVGSTRDGGGR